MTDVAIRDEESKPSELSQMWTGLVELAKDPSVDPEKIKALAELQRDMIRDRRQEEFNRDKIAAVMEMPVITKDGKVINHKTKEVQSRYSTFEKLYAVVKPILEKHHLALTFDIDEKQGFQGVLVTPILAHTNGHVERGGSMPLAIDTTGSKNATQGAGSSSSYGKRHTMKAMLNIVEEGIDDDGASAGRQIPQHGGEWDKLVDDARAAATGGSASYETFFKSLTGMQRGYLMDKGEHGKLKEAAAAHD